MRGIADKFTQSARKLLWPGMTKMIFSLAVIPGREQSERTRTNPGMTAYEPQYL
jgi:hypothetical protein